MTRERVIDILREDTQAWEFGCFSWDGDVLIFNESTARDYLTLKRQVKTSQTILLDQSLTHA